MLLKYYESAEDKSFNYLCCMKRRLLLSGSIFALLSVVLGAFAAHALKSKVEEGVLTPYNLHSFQTGVTYQMYHSLALLLVAVFFEKTPSRFLTLSGYFFIAGILLFSGSLYLLSTQKLLFQASLSWLGPITPLGGICFITGWLLLFLSFYKERTQ